MAEGPPGTGVPLVSVIIPTHNRPALLARAVRSAVAQTYPNLEVWVFDDASDPPATLPLEARGDARVNLVRSERHVVMRKRATKR